MDKGSDLMDIGMLWFDATPDRSLVAKVERAATYYRDKYGRLPTICYVHHDGLAPTLILERPIKVLGIHDVLPDHFWLGVAKDSGKEESKAL